MAQWVESLVTRLDNPSSVPGVYLVGETQLLQMTVSWLLHMGPGKWGVQPPERKEFQNCKANKNQLKRLGGGTHPKAGTLEAEAGGSQLGRGRQGGGRELQI